MTAMASIRKRKWKSGDEVKTAWIADYFDQVLSAISDVHTDVRDVATREWADTGVVTCVIDQAYRYEGRMERITAPTTFTSSDSSQSARAEAGPSSR